MPTTRIEDSEYSQCGGSQVAFKDTYFRLSHSNLLKLFRASMCCFVCVEGSVLQDLNSTAKNYGRCTALKVVRATEEPRWIPLCSVDAGWASYTMATMEWLERIVLVFEAQVDTGGKISPSCSWRSICRIDPFTCLTRFQAQTRFVIFVDILQRGRDCAVSGFIVSSLLFLPILCWFLPVVVLFRLVLQLLEYA